MNKTYIKTTIREIKGSFERYIAILAIVFLGVGFFTGLKMTKPSMVASVNKYLHEQNFYDFRFISTLGFSDENVNEAKNLPGTVTAEGGISTDALCSIDGSSEEVYKIHSIPEDINLVTLETGRMPENSNECLLDSRLFDGHDIGSEITVTENNDEDTFDLFKERTFTVTGKIRSPLYMNFERGTTSIGEGRVKGFFYVPKDAFDCDYVTEIYIKTEGDYDIYTDEYNDHIDSIKSAMEKSAGALGSARYESIVSEAQDKVDDARKELDDKKADAQKELDDALKKLKDGEKELEEHSREISDGKEQLDDAKSQITSNERNLSVQEQQFNAVELPFPPELFELIDPAALTPEQLIQYQIMSDQLSQYNAAREQLQAGRRRLNNAKDEISEKEQELLDGEKELEDARKELADGWKEYNDALADFEKEINDAQEKLDDAEEEIHDIELPDTYVLTRNQNIGYVCFENDSNIVAAIANVFPVFFFLVAALITMTTMNRMVEDQRTQIGIMKALGYSNALIIFKFAFYAGSAALIGALSGYAVGIHVFPATIWAVYGIMYDAGYITIVFNIYLAVIVTLVSLAGVIGTTYFTCRYELVNAPANLIRPKAPRGGKRIFLERVTFIWNRMKFLRKVSMRNLFRYKKRFFMMILGISGCTALLLTGFGLKDSIVDIADMQYDEIQVYDVSVSFKDALDSDTRAAFADESGTLLDGIAFCYEENVDIDFNGRTKTIYLQVAENPEDFCKYIHLVTENDEEIPYPGKGDAVITIKMADTLGLGIGDTVTLRDNDMRQFSVRIAGLCKNYVYNYIYISKETYEECIGEPLYKNAYTRINEGIDVHSAAASLSDIKDVLSVSVTLDSRNRISKMMSSMNYIVLLVIVCAGFLAFIVLYNLTNINIMERIREIATIKVLGFYAAETADYVFRENFLLTGMGAAIGLLPGKWLHWFVLYNINIDMVSFKTYISVQSYLFSLLLTFLFAVLVNAIMFMKLERINMAESLKSVE